MKRDRDDTDFRAIRESYDKREEGCAFCNLPPKRIVMNNNLAMVIHDEYPVSPLHTLIIPKRHVDDYFELGTSEMKACNALLQEAKDTIKEEDGTIGGFNEEKGTWKIRVGGLGMLCRGRDIMGKTPDPSFSLHVLSLI